jgi:predicted TIM-barrel fold metal-dependent hydrolase
MIQSGVLRRHPRLRVILSHAGGFLPYVVDRLTLILSGRAGGGEPVPAQTVREDLRRFYFDTALSSSSALPSLLAFAHPGRVLYGTDWPLCPASAVTDFTARLDTFLSDTDRTRVNRANAEKLFPRLALKPAPR